MLARAILLCVFLPVLPLLPFLLGMDTNGYTFESTDGGGLDYALNRALATWYNDRAYWHTLAKRVMGQVRGSHHTLAWQFMGQMRGLVPHTSLARAGARTAH